MQKSLEQTFTGGEVPYRPRFIDVLMLMPGLRDRNEYWSKCELDSEGVPIELDNKSKIV